MTKIQRLVYVIDDDASIRKSLSRLLRSADIDAETFSSPEDFLNGSRQEQNACIIADLRMPGTTGFDLAEKLLAKCVSIPIVIISASSDNQTRQRARDLYKAFLKHADKPMRVMAGLLHRGRLAEEVMKIEGTEEKGGGLASEQQR